MTAVCWVERCDVPVKSKGLCQWHYERTHTYKDFGSLAGPRPPRPTCVECGKTLRNITSRRCASHRAAVLIPRDWRNPLVCDCPEPDADPRRDFGMCQRCKRKPLELMAVAS